MCHNIPGDSTSDKYVTKIPRFGSGWIVFMELVQNSLVGHNATTCPPMYECTERVLKGDVKDTFFNRQI